MAAVALQQVSSRYARANAARTLEKPVALKYIKHFMDPGEFSSLESASPSGLIYMWGSKMERLHQFEKMVDCVFLFRRNNVVYRCGQMCSWTYSEELANYLWGADPKDEKTWGLIYFFKEVRELAVPAREINAIIGLQLEYHWQGLLAYTSPVADEVIDLVKSKLVVG